MYAYNQHAGTPVSQGYAPNAGYGNASGYSVNPAFVPPPGIVTSIVPNPSPAFGAGQTLTQFRVSPRHTPTPPVPPPLNAVQVPPGCYPIELAQFWRDEHGRGHPFPLHWALFVRTVPASGSTRARAATAHAHARAAGPQGNFYELVGSPETYTAQFFAGSVAPETLPDWRGSHVVGWVHPAALGTFERAARQVQVWRRRPDWRCQQWVYEVACGLVGCEGIYVEGCSFERMYRQMGWLLEAWENGDI